jgi:hypothetical protein
MNEGFPMPKQLQDGAALSHKKINVTEKLERRAARWQLFVKYIGRKAQRGVEPNDRKHSVRMDRSLRRMRPEDFDTLVRYGEED